MTYTSSFGADPLYGHGDLQRIRERDYHDAFEPETIFSHVVTGINPALLCDAFHHFKSLTEDLAGKIAEA